MRGDHDTERVRLVGLLLTLLRALNRLRGLWLLFGIRGYERIGVLINSVYHGSHQIAIDAPAVKLLSTTESGNSSRLKGKLLNQGEYPTRRIPRVGPQNTN